jgi:hypothetical protein
MKYRQRGYKEDDWEDRQRDRRREKKGDDLGNRHQMRSLRHAIDREVTVVLRCGKCGYQVPISQLEIEKDTTCLKCRTPLHSCRHCKQFDPGSRFECREPIEARLTDKWAANDCQLYKPVQVLDATGRRAQGAEDAKTAFHNLFKN